MTNVDAMLDRLAPEAVNEWVAFRQVERDPDEWLREIVKRGFAALCNCQGAKVKPDDLDPAKDEEQNKPVSPRQAAAQAELLFRRRQ
jgi:hypothetical protein